MEVIVRASNRLRKVAKRFSNRLRREPTKAERYFKHLLKSIKVAFKSEKVIYNQDSFYIVDFYLPDKRLCVELDGGYHNEPDQIEKDRVRDEYLKDKGYKVWRMTNEEAFALTPESIRTRIQEFTSKPRTIRILSCREPLPKLPPTKGKKKGYRKRIRKANPIKTSHPQVEAILLNKLRRERIRKS